MGKKNISFFKSIIILLFLLSSMEGFSQISIIPDNPQTASSKTTPVSKAFSYDSLTNVIPHKIDYRDDYRHLIGQTMLYMGDPWKYHYNSPKFSPGHYCKVIDVTRYLDISSGPYTTIVVEDTITHQTASFDCNHSNFNELWVVVGYYEKMKRLYIGKKLVYKKFSYLPIENDYKPYDVIKLSNDSSLADISDGSIWTCTDVSVRPRTAEIWKSQSSDHRSPVVLVIENPTYGKCYTYLEDKDGEQYKSLSFIKSYETYNLPLICGHFLAKTPYEKAIIQNKQNNTARMASLTKRFGKANAQLIYKGSIRVGMTKEMCREAWGNPERINSTVTSGSTFEQWVYGDSYVYFQGNRITTIQY